MNTACGAETADACISYAWKPGGSVLKVKTGNSLLTLLWYLTDVNCLYVRKETSFSSQTEMESK